MEIRGHPHLSSPRAWSAGRRIRLTISSKAGVDRRVGPTQTGVVIRGAIRDFLKVTPFKPFELDLASGRVLPVVTRDHLFLPPKDQEIIVALPEGGFQVVDPEHIESIAHRRRAKAA
jgi:hypothetical protein